MTPTLAPLAARTPPDWDAVYAAFLAELRAVDVGAAAPKVGETMPDFALPDAEGRYRTLSGLMAGAPMVLSFQRGAWCPYCRGELAAWAELLPALRAAGAGFAAVTAETGGRAARWRAKIGLDAPMLCDLDHGVALSLGLAFKLPAAVDRTYRAVGLDLSTIYGGAGGLLPIPAVFALDGERRVLHAFVEPDFRRRADPHAVIAALG